jgi:hypothetical protein
VNTKSWLAAISPRAGLDYLCSAKACANRSKAGRRKLRLFLCACARRVWDLIPEGAHRKAVELGERLCEGENVAAQVAKLGDREFEGSLEHRHAAHTAMACVMTNIGHAVITGADAAAMAAAWARQMGKGGYNPQDYVASKAAEERAQSALLREVVANPFRPVAFSPNWRTDTVITLARLMYESRDFSAMPILADAIQDAGCDSAELLEHCRDANAVHVRGCWVVDLVLVGG